MCRSPRNSTMPSSRAGPSASSTPMIRIRAIPIGICTAIPCSISRIRPASSKRSTSAARPSPSTTCASPPSMPRAAGKHRACPTSSIGPRWNPASSWCARSARAARSATPSAPMRPTSPKASVTEALEQLDAELVGLVPVKTRLREIAAFLAVEKARTALGMASGAPSLHMSFTGNPGTGKTTVAMRIAEILHRLGFVRKGHLIAVTRDDLVGQYIGHTAPKTKEVLKRAMGGVLFIDEAYYLYRPENERDYGQEAIEILLQVMENQRADLVVILAGYKERIGTFSGAAPGFPSRIAHHLDFPDYTRTELSSIAGRL